MIINASLLCTQHHSRSPFVMIVIIILCKGWMMVAKDHAVVLPSFLLLITSLDILQHIFLDSGFADKQARRELAVYRWHNLQ
jgi:hypothetical protein